MRRGWLLTAELRTTAVCLSQGQEGTTGGFCYDTNSMALIIDWRRICMPTNGRELEKKIPHAPSQQDNAASLKGHKQGSLLELGFKKNNKWNWLLGQNNPHYNKYKPVREMLSTTLCLIEEQMVLFCMAAVHSCQLSSPSHYRMPFSFI